MKFTGVITKEEKWYVAHCIELGVVSQGKTIEEAQANLKEAVELYLEEETGDNPNSPLKKGGRGLYKNVFWQKSITIQN